MTKNTHFITIVSPSPDISTHPVSISIDLTKEEYELINRIGVLLEDAADITQPILIISQPVIDKTAENIENLEINPTSDEI